MTQPRHHLVLVPGFLGFDILGQVHYYTGVTALHNIWQNERANRASSSATSQLEQNTGPGPALELHYFDNLPTASVATRADRLRVYLAKRLARGSFRKGDAVTLVGHSTGGLDIRQMLYDLQQPSHAFTPVDGDEASIPASDLLRVISGIVFLSVPQYGTSLADWVIAHAFERTIVTWLAASLAPVAAQAVPWNALDALKGLTTSSWNIFHSTVGVLFPFLGPAQPFQIVGANLASAVEDALRESSQALAGGDAIKQANAREAASELNLFLDNIKEDFAAIQDLRTPSSVARQQGVSTSPAHFSDAQRVDEKDSWARNNIKTLSFATLGNRPPPFAGNTRYSGRAAPNWNPLNPLDDMKLNAQGFDSTYLAGYFATAGGNFETNVGDQTVTDVQVGQKTMRYFEKWDNDGVVNTASMLWPDGDETRLVHADHGDIIGHFKQVEAVGTPRRFNRYDFFVSAQPGSANKFDDDQFRKVWFAIFDFGVSESVVRDQ